MEADKMNMYKIRPLNDRTDYYIALEDIDYLKYVENNSRSLLAPLEDNYGHFEVYFKNSRLKQLSPVQKKRPQKNRFRRRLFPTM